MSEKISSKLTKKSLLDLKELCEWLDTIPYKSAYPFQIRPEKPYLLYLLKSDYYPVRKVVNCIFYMRGWGWRLRKDWLNNINELLAK